MRILSIERLRGGTRRYNPDHHQHGQNTAGNKQNHAGLLGDKDKNHNHRADIDDELGQVRRQEIAQNIHARQPVENIAR